MLTPGPIPAPSPLERAAHGVHEWSRRQGLQAWLELGWITLSGRQRDGAALAGALGRLKGPFAKLGQLASTRVDALPAETRARFAALRDRVPPLPFWRMARALEAELGRPLRESFAAIDPVPLGAASVAQVHRARLLDGREVAVKVQYPWLEASAERDLRLLRRLVRRLAPETDRGALFDEFAAAFRDELDFEREARMAGEIARNLADDDRIVVPGIIAEHSTRRVLTMTWLPTLSLQDPKTLRARGVPLADVMKHLVAAYARQIFVDGLFHADPHAGNLFVVDEPRATTEPRVLFVDFGLSQRLDPSLRREVRHGIYALLQHDLEGFLAAMQRMQMIEPGSEEAARRSVGTVFGRLRGGGAGGALALSGDGVLALKDEATALLYETPGLTLPPQLLLYAKTLSYVFTLGRELAPELDLMKIAVPYLLRFLAERD